VLKIAAVFEVLPKKVFCLLPCDVTWTAKPFVFSRVGPWQKREDL